MTVFKPWFPIYLMPYVCLDCQKAFKYQQSDQQKVCPQCKIALVMLSRKFKTPKQTDRKEWQKVRYLIEQGFRFQSIHEEFYNQKVLYPKTLEEAYEFVKKYKSSI